MTEQARRKACLNIVYDFCDKNGVDLSSVVELRKLNTVEFCGVKDGNTFSIGYELDANP